MLTHLLGLYIACFHITSLSDFWIYLLHHSIVPGSRDSTGESVSNRFFLSFSWQQRNHSVAQSQERRDNQKEHAAASPCKSFMLFLFTNRFKLFRIVWHGFTYLKMGTDIFARIPYSMLLLAFVALFYAASRYCSSMFKCYPWNKLNRPGLEKPLGLPIWDVQFQICQTDAELLHRARFWRFTQSPQGLQPN